jgi:4-amino-4-deoxy-L-arabinose transferase-like glycosyltransferase
MSLEIILIIAIFLVSYFLILRNFEFSLYVLLGLSILLHKELFSIYQWNLMGIRVFMLALLCVGVTKTYLWFFKDVSWSGRKKKLDWSRAKELFSSPYLVLLSSLWVIRGVSIIFTKNLQASLLLFGFFTTVVFLSFLMWYFLKGKSEKIFKYIKAYIFIVFGLTIFGYFQYYLYSQTGVIIGALWNVPGNVARVGATFWDVNHYGALLAGLLPILGVLILTEGPFKKKALYSAIFLSLFVTLFLTSSRTAWIIDGVAFLSFVTVLLVRKFGPRGISYIIVTLFLVSLPLIREYSIKSSPFRAKIKQYFHYRMDSFDSHFMLLTGTYQIFEEYPFLGGGYGGFFEHFSKTDIAPTYFGRDPAALNTRVPAHTIWGELMAETGIFGLLVFTALVFLVLGTLLYGALKLAKPKDYLMLSAMFSVVLGWMVAGIFYSYNSEFFWLVLNLFFLYGISVLGKNYSLKKIIPFFARHRKFPVLVIGILGFVLIFSNLGKNHLIPWDEAIYAKIAKNMVQNGEYLVQYWDPARVWYEKPPFYMWAMTASMKILGFNSWGAKLPSAVFGFSTLFLVYTFGRKLFNKTAGFISAFVLLTTVHFLYYSRLSMTDVTATFFISLALFLYYLAKEKEQLKLWIFSGVSAGFAIMTKGVVGFLPFGIIGVYELYLLISSQQVLTKKLFKNYGYLFGASSLIFLPWHLEMYRRFGADFISNYIGYHVLERATEAIEDKGRPFFWYLTVLKVSMRIWFVGLVASLPVVFRRVLKKDNRIIFLVIWFTFTFLFFSSATSKLVWYVMPLYPAAALIVGYFSERLLNWFMEKYSHFNSYMFKFSVLCSLVVFGLFYLFLNRNLVYVPDLSGEKSRLLKLKDEKLGVERKLYTDRVELPLIRFYTDGPFEGIDYSPKKGRVPVVLYMEELTILGKRGRYEEAPILGEKGGKVVGEERDWMLWFYESDYEVDTEALDEINDELEELYKLEKIEATVGGAQRIAELTVEKQIIEDRITRNSTAPGESF